MISAGRELVDATQPHLSAAGLGARRDRDGELMDMPAGGLMDDRDTRVRVGWLPVEVRVGTWEGAAVASRSAR